MNIRDMSLNDLENIKNILESDFDEFWNYNILKEELESNNSHFIVATEADEIIGFAGIKIILDEADIMNIVTKKSFRHQGIGSSLLDWIINYSKESNLNKISLEVNEHNLSAIRLYNKFEFDHIGIRKKYYNGTSDAIIMSKNLR